MTPDFNLFKKNFITDVETNRALMGEGLRKSFVECLCDQIPDEESPTIQLVYVDTKFGSKRIGVDGYVFNSEENTLLLVIADFNEFSDETKLIRSEAENTWFKKLRNFFKLSRMGRLQDPVSSILEWSTPEYELASLIQEENIDRVRLLLLTDRRLSDKFTKLDNSPICDIPVTEEVWALELLYQHLKSGLDHVPLEIEFEDAPIPLTLATSGDGFKSYLGVISALKLSNIYQEHGGRLLEGNVRSYLTLKSQVNRDIRGTILSKPEHFFIYNNGIAVTAQNLVFDSEGRLIKATDFQIINGGQTTASLARAVFSDKADVSGIQVALKLTEIDADLDPIQSRELIRNISRYSNNQNKVSGADFSSNHEFHVLMEQCAQRIPAPPARGMIHGSYWFYERNRGSYLQAQMFMSEGEKKAFTAKSDKNHVVKKEELARVRLAWNQEPDIVSKGAQTLFSHFMNQLDEDWATKRKAGHYGDDYFRDSIALIVMYKQLRTLVSDQSWYDKGYLANIVAYGMSAFIWLFKKQFGAKAVFDLGQIWKKQEIPEQLTGILLDICREVKNCLTSSKRKKENVTEWAKMSACWKFVQEHFNTLHFTLPEDVESWKKSNEKIRSDRTRAVEQTAIDNSVSLMQWAMDYQHWEEALSFDHEHGFLTPLQEKAIRKCMQIPMKIPTDKEIQHAKQGLEELRQEGFKH